MNHFDQLLKTLLNKKLLDDVTYEALHQKYTDNTDELFQYVLRSNIIDRRTLGKIWADIIGYTFIDLSKVFFQNEIVRMIPEEMAEKNKIILLYKFDEVISAACADPLNFNSIREMEYIVKAPISTLFCFSNDVLDAIAIQYRTDQSLVTTSKKIDKIRSLENLQEIARDNAVIDFTKELILLASKERTSDIHIEPEELYLRIRFRIDGVLQERFSFDISFHRALVSRLKILANLNITERRLPQDGRIKFEMSSQSIDLRFSSAPTIYGEKIVLRLLGRSSGSNIPDIKKLNFTKKNYQILKKTIAASNGIFLVTGPTGSGKSTTLYSLLQHINNPEVNIMTIEDPVEYRLEGVNQFQINTKIGFTFNSALRAFLRQDPDVILVGEIRDMETAKIASEAALTGHIVFGTMHTNSAIEAITRLIEMGVKPYIIAPAIVSVLAQRLVRKICENCKEKYKLTDSERDSLFICDKNTEVFLYRGKGCSNCNNTGYLGRIAIHEIIHMNQELRTLIMSGASVFEINIRALELGFQSLRYDGLKKALRGQTTLDEINKFTMSEE